ncbi:MAG: dTMP kinase, partial [SAR324 cluster bacterium]|nr:dTMP kinase [SAR324 cluster bacterium]
MKPGTFITFEGIDGCGKTTQIQLARTFLEKQGNQVITTLEPGGTDIGIQIRKILLNQKNQSLVQESEMLLYLADRIQHLKEVILPALEKGNLVLCDRFHDSTVAYQGFGRGLDLKLIRSIEEKAITPHAPFLTFLLDIEPKLALK